VAASGPFHLGLGRFHSSAQASASLPAGPGQLPAHLAQDVITCITAASAGKVEADRQGVEEAYLEVLEVPLRDAVAMVHSGEITDAKTVIGLTMALARTGG
jgi:hypothetical protein